MDPKEFNNLASELAAGNTPVKIRTAINRAYYAAFLIGHALLTETLRIPVSKTGKGHQDVKVFLGASGDRVFNEVSSKLGTLQRDRIQADYYPENETVERLTKAQSSVVLAKGIIAIMSNAIGRTRRLQITKAIQDYRKRFPD